MIDLTIASTCDRFLCMNIDVGSILIGIGLGVILVYVLFRKKLVGKKENE